MLTKDFDYSLPDELIAQSPTQQRNQSRLLVVSQQEPFRDLHIQTFATALEWIAGKRGKAGRVPLIILNESKVYPARVMISKKSGAKGEAFILNDVVLGTGAGVDQCGQAPRDSELASVLLRPLKKMKTGDVLYDAAGQVALFEIVHKGSQSAKVRLLRPLQEIFSTFAAMPTPPYIRRHYFNGDSDRKPDPLVQTDFERYQNVYATNLGSAAAPTAGLHFSQDFLHMLEKNKQAEFAKVTLHVGIGTFRPVQAEAPADHEMHSEYYSISKEALQQIRKAHEEKRAIVYLGTTSFRAVESFLRRIMEAGAGGLNDSGCVPKATGRLFEEADALCDRLLETNLFVYPESVENELHLPIVGDALFTNFHQPQSTLLMLVCALSGYKRTMAAYAHAVQQGYRFLSYGDASLFEFAQESIFDRSCPSGKYEMG